MYGIGERGLPVVLRRVSDLCCRTSDLRQLHALTVNQQRPGNVWPHTAPPTTESLQLRDSGRPG